MFNFWYSKASLRFGKVKAGVLRGVVALSTALAVLCPTHAQAIEKCGQTMLRLAREDREKASHMARVIEQEKAEAKAHGFYMDDGGKLHTPTIDIIASEEEQARAHGYYVDAGGALHTPKSDAVSQARLPDNAGKTDAKAVSSFADDPAAHGTPADIFPGVERLDPDHGIYSVITPLTPRYKYLWEASQRRKASTVILPPTKLRVTAPVAGAAASTPAIKSPTGTPARTSALVSAGNPVGPQKTGLWVKIGGSLGKVLTAPVTIPGDLLKHCSFDEDKQLATVLSNFSDDPAAHGTPADIFPGVEKLDPAHGVNMVASKVTPRNTYLWSIFQKMKGHANVTQSPGAPEWPY